MRTVDVMIIGQGIAGTLLSFELMEAGLNVLVIDRPVSQSASRIASGVINPVTGRRVVETWKIEALLSQAQDSYQRISRLLQIETVARKIEILSIHGTQQMQEAFNSRQAAGSRFVQSVEKAGQYTNWFQQPFGMHATTEAMLICLQRLLPKYRQWLRDKDCLIEADFDWSRCQIEKDPPVGQASICYQGALAGREPVLATRIIAAEGIGAATNPYFNQLSMRFNKGEALIVDIPGLPSDKIYKLRYTVVPWQGNEVQTGRNLFWVGSSYEWDYPDDLPTDAFRSSVTQMLQGSLNCPFEVIDHLASVRPASINRRPFAGPHPSYPALGILNGLGTKGCSLAPYLAKSWRDYLITGRPFDPEVALQPPRH